mgnify:CR=1 FL=1
MIGRNIVAAIGLAVGLAGFAAIQPATAAKTVCLDVENSGAGNPNNNNNASSSITDDGTATVTADSASLGDLTNGECGPYAGNNDNNNVDGLFGVADWTSLGKNELNSDGTQGGITLTGAGTTSGTMSFDFSQSLYLIVLKFDGVYSAFKAELAAGVTAVSGWGWDTDEDDNGKFANSHLSVYGTNDPVNVPAPATLGLLGIGLGLAGVFASRRRKNNAD